jgi:glutamyl-tRNA reductase
MALVVLGLNHKTASVDIRECFSFSEEQIKQGLKHRDEYDDILECMILSTCNRTEMYAVVDDPEEALPVMQDYLRRMNSQSQLWADHFYFYKEEECIHHLFRVVSSLDSLVVGEGQILSQVKKAYTLARDTGTTGVVLNTLFNRAISVGKRIRTKTKIAHSAVSVSYAAVELAKQNIGDLSQATVLILGAGEMSELTAKHLVASGVKTVFVSNRNPSRAELLAEKFRGTAIPFEDFLKCAVHADIIITSTGAPHYIIRAWDVAHLMPKRQGRPLLFIDIAVPRDVEPEVETISGVQLFNIDALEAVVASNKRGRAKEARAAEGLIEKELAEILTRFRYLAFRPTLTGLTDKAEAIRQRELKRALNKLPEMAAEERKVMENLSKMLMRKLLRDPIINIHEAVGTAKEQYVRDAVCQLFKLDEMGEVKKRDKKTCNRYAR